MSFLGLKRCFVSIVMMQFWYLRNYFDISNVILVVEAELYIP